MSSSLARTHPKPPFLLRPSSLTTVSVSLRVYCLIECFFFLYLQVSYGVHQFVRTFNQNFISNLSFSICVALAFSIVSILLFLGGYVGEQVSVLSWTGTCFSSVLAFLLSLGVVLYLLISPSLSWYALLSSCIQPYILLIGIPHHLPSFCRSFPSSWDIILRAALQVFHIVRVGFLILGRRPWRFWSLFKLNLVDFRSFWVEYLGYYFYFEV